MSEITLPVINGATILSLGGGLLNKAPFDELNKILNTLNMVLHDLKAIVAALAVVGQLPPPPLVQAIAILQGIVDGPFGHIVSYIEKQFDTFVKNLTLYAEHTKIMESMGITSKTKAANESLKAFGSICGEIAADIQLIKDLVAALTDLSPDKVLAILRQLLPIVEKIFNITIAEQQVQDNMMTVLVELQQARSYAEHINNPVLQPIFSLVGTQSLKDLLNGAIDQNIRNLGFVPPSVAAKLTHII